ncbi:hypothetical protein [Streptomyces sp. SID11385]|uniref:hypothetical protein n=1 Tax=Streptomyces sp. SID11385 TaxID=2706031 RepID=UPI0013CAA917|nr:hypothetical protein [Streptomyces sp. SID11385]NEA40776.1 hypothetical protein [Streptomyces sp. SID11385]
MAELLSWMRADRPRRRPAAPSTIGPLPDPSQGSSCPGVATPWLRSTARAIMDG